MSRGITTNKRFKSQSAIEYLMTYGWAVLIIAVILLTLYRFGIFNPCTFVPKAAPGSCQVFRPNGPHSNMLLNLRGVCSGVLPQYIGYFGVGNAMIPSSSIINLSSYTISAWVFPQANSWNTLYGEGWAGFPFFYVFGNPVGISAFARNDLDQAKVYLMQSTSNVNVPIKSWHMLTVTLNSSGYNTGNWIIYLDGIPSATLNGQWSTLPSGVLTGNTLTAVMGGSYNSVIPSFQGLLANLQIYNTALSANDVQTLYLKGMGGVPIRLQNLVGWWPINGDFSDYSGNNNNGAQVGSVTFRSFCTSNYTKP